MKKYEDILEKRISKVDDRVIESFLRYPWPGNVRELQNVIERMMNFARANELTYDLVPEEIIKSRSIALYTADLESPAETEKKAIIKLLDLNFDRNKIAEKMNMSRATLYRKMRKYGISIKKESHWK
jgi:transcriptional regulator with PAS, ATPase and Fis domain